MNDEKTAESFLARVVIALTSAILHYALYKATVASIVLMKGCVVWLFREISKFNLSRGANTSSRMDPPLSCPA